MGMVDKKQGRMMLTRYRTSWRRRLANLPPSKKMEMFVFGAVAIGFCSVATLYFA